MNNDELEQRLQKIEADIGKMREHPYWKKDLHQKWNNYFQQMLEEDSRLNTGENND